jgi:hypothetical protein
MESKTLSCVEYLAKDNIHASTVKIKEEIYTFSC